MFTTLLTNFDHFINSRDAIGAKEKKVSMSTSKPAASMAGDPFVVLQTTSSSAGPSPGIFTDRCDESGKAAKNQGKSCDDSGGDNDNNLFEDSSSFNHASKSEPLFTSVVNIGPKDWNNLSKARDSSPVQSAPKRSSAQQPSVEDNENIFPKSQSARYSDVHVDIASEKYSGNGINDQSPRSDECEDEIWLTVSEIPLFTQPTSAPPPSRPPPLAAKQKPHGPKAKRKDDAYQWHSSKNYSHHRSSSKQAGVSSIDELEDFAMGKSQSADAFNEGGFGSTAAAAMKEAVDKAEAKFKHAKEVRERERIAKLRNSEHQQQGDEARSSSQDRETEQRRLEEEKEIELQRDREKARQAVERATKEARERAAAEARAKAEREARQRAERAAVQRAQQEVRERAAVGAKERAERAAAEAKERTAAEAKEKTASQAKDRAAAERAAVDRAQQEARRRAERAAVEKTVTEARERQAAAAAAREKQSKPDDLESFGMGARANSAPKKRAPTVVITQLTNMLLIFIYCIFLTNVLAIVDILGFYV
jgi:hypothetical protein